MPTLTKHAALSALSIKRLGGLCDVFGLPRADLKSQELLVDTLACAEQVSLPAVLGQLNRDELKALCRARGLDESGKVKAQIAARLLGDPKVQVTIPGSPGIKRGRKPRSTPEPAAPPGGRAPASTATPSANLEFPDLALPVTSEPAPDAAATATAPPEALGARLPDALLEWAPGSPGALPIAPGAHILVRDAVWRVQQVNRTSAGKSSWSVVGISEIVRDQEAIFLEEYEPSVKVLDPAETQLELDTSTRHRDSLLYMESLLRDVPPTGPALHIGHRAAMDVMEYQLEPSWKALTQLRQRILIADAVGLGKTLEAGILLSELIRRGRGKRILVATVKSMLTQFQKEMWARFSIPLVRLDSQGLQRIREHIPTNHNPFYHFDKVIISIDTLKQSNAFRTHLEQAWWDVIVIDEAHNVALRGGGHSQRAKIAEKLADRSDAMILLSATPHDGTARSFASLMNMLDPTAIANPDKYERKDIDGLFVRRFKNHIKDQLGAEFPERIITKIAKPASLGEEAVYEALTGVEFEYFHNDREGGILFKTSLEKALFSSPYACSRVLTAPLRRKGVIEHLPGDFFPRGRRDARLPSEVLASAQLHLTGPLARDVAKLHRFAQQLEQIEPATFSKYQQLLQTITSNQPGCFNWTASARDDRIVIFSERIETLHYLREHLTRDLNLKPEQVELLHGGLPDSEQQRIVEDFGKSTAKVRVLLASDFASEGLNLHYLCHRLIHFDIPWSLMVFHQRNGRIDRYGQAARPEIVYLLTEAKNDKIRGDTRILELLIKRDKQVYENIGDVSAVMGVHDVSAEESVTAEAMTKNMTPEQFDQALDSSTDSFELYLGGQGSDPTAVPRQKRLLSLFASDLDYVKLALDRLAEVEGLKRVVEAGNDPSVEIHMPPDDEASRRARLPGVDLRRRFRRFPAEIMPADGVIVLSPDAAKVQRAITEARREENAWPRIQYLWPNNPVVHWLSDKGRAIFGRHTAPVMTLIDGLAADEAVVVVSGLIPNRRSQPLVHRWFAVRFRGGEFAEVEDFGDCVTRLGLNKRPLRNRNVAADIPGLQRLIPEAVSRTRAEVLAWRERYQAEIHGKLKDELNKLHELRNRQLAELAAKLAAKPNLRQTHEQRERRVHRIFDRYVEWATDSLTSAPAPFLQVIAVMRPETGFGGVA